VHPGVAAVVDRWLKEDLNAGGPQFVSRGMDVVDQEPGDGSGGEVAVDRTVGSKTSTLLPSGSFSIQNPGRSSSSRRPSTSPKKATVGSAFSVRVPTQANLLIRMGCLR
jgi:hypothetical protein